MRCFRSVALGVVAAVGAVPGAAGGSLLYSVGRNRVGSGSELALGQAPAGLRLAVGRVRGGLARGTLWSPGGPGELGASVAVDGSTAVVGAPGDNLGRGAAYVFVHSGGAWTEQAKLNVKGEEPSCAYSYPQRGGQVCTADGEGFGESVAISGSTVVVGAPRRSGFRADRRGAAYVFVRSGSAWSEQAELRASDGFANAGFGASVAISGSTVVVCGAGAAYVFTRSGTGWPQQTKLTAATGGQDGGLGGPAAIYGSTVVVGAPDEKQGSRHGAVYVFVGSGSVWSEQAELTAPDTGPAELFGASVAIHGSTVVVGTPFKNFERGAAYVFVHMGTAWSEQAELTIAPGTRAHHQFAFGASVAIYHSRIVVGAPWKKSHQGAAYVFARLEGSWSKQTKLVSRDGAAGDDLGASVAIDKAGALVGAFEKPPRGAVYVFAPSRTSWTQRAELTAKH
jgi:hypothetical protein